MPHAEEFVGGKTPPVMADVTPADTHYGDSPSASSLASVLHICAQRNAWAGIAGV
jgi:hypothetical protein